MAKDDRDYDKKRHKRYRNDDDDKKADRGGDKAYHDKDREHRYAKNSGGQGKDGHKTYDHDGGKDKMAYRQDRGGAKVMAKAKYGDRKAKDKGKVAFRRTRK